MNEVVSIKGTRHGLLIFFDPQKDFDDIRSNLHQKMKAARGFFQGAEFAFYQEPAAQEHRKELENICQQYGLIYQPDIRVKITTPKESSPPAASQQPPLESAHQSAGKVNSEKGDTLLVKRGLRSGQRIHYPGHVLVLGDIHPGSEVVAYGNVMVMGNCRGVVHAGAAGDLSARVIAHRLSPSQLRIGSSIACAPSEAQQETFYPEVAYLSKEGQIIVAAYNSSRPLGKN
ncbi:septum site-determining protein MinC [Desulforamulus ruminis]|uniref:Probable septum site-determining protein MinC n=1 Tax=Desulforamulus ruminis (strain ATCC 23193 / DSM 2154 / NCIMB 8452 / DL) TaxID=696281 RepID=F6DUT2_DESRL|nr:septum site-determining protein MinC [Desulforamulus ruminis]AEG60220.1 septum site-determining protein MinC [Desulforamulus ruminis DSM 2154]